MPDQYAIALLVCMRGFCDLVVIPTEAQTSFGCMVLSNQIIANYLAGHNHELMVERWQCVKRRRHE